jgi:hypothetical protein
MSKPQRFDIDNDGEFYNCDEGDLIYYKDYQSLLEMNAKLVAALERYSNCSENWLINDSGTLAQEALEAHKLAMQKLGEQSEHS